MAKYSMKRDGKEVGPASVYAEPHTMQGKKVKAETNPGSNPNRSKLDTVNMVVGNIARNEPAVKTSGIKMARGPMA
jgi:hypothetical protein